MERIELHDKKFRLFIPNEKIEEAIDAVASKINADYMGSGSTPVFLSVLNGSFMFTASLLQKIEFGCEVSFVKLASYSGTSSTGQIKELIGAGSELEGRDVIIVEDIVDSGRTIVELHEILTRLGVSSVRICTLFYKPKAYKKFLRIDYPAMEIGNEFIVGFGLDYDQLGRQYKDIYIIENQ